MAEEQIIKVGWEHDPSSIVSVPLFRLNEHNINRIFKCETSYLIDQFGVVLWPQEWERKCQPPPWKYFIVPKEKMHDMISADDDVTYDGDSEVFVLNVPANCKEPELVAWFRAGMASCDPAIIQASKDLQDTKAALNRLLDARAALLRDEGVSDPTGLDSDLPRDVQEMAKMAALMRKRKVLEKSVPAKSRELEDLISVAQQLRVRFRHVRKQGDETDPLFRPNAVVGITAELMGLGKQAKKGGKEVTKEEQLKLKERLHTWSVEIDGEDGEDVAQRASEFKEWGRVQLIVGGEDQRNPDAGPVAKYLTEGQDISDTPEGADLMERLKLFGTNMREVAVVRLRHGKGSAKTADGLHRVYAGEFVAGLRDGKGIEIGPDGTYDGEWRDNMRKGKGTLRTAYGDVYSGDFGVGDEDKEMPGFMEGTMAAEVIARQCKKPLDLRTSLAPPIWPIRNMHELEVTNPYKIGLPCGLGEIKFADGSVYKGQVRNGRPNGTGEYISASGEKKLGTFKNGVLVGVGTERTHDGISRKGEWRHGNLFNKSVLHTESGDVVETDAHFDVLRGRTKASFKKGMVKYVGMYEDSRRHGFGVMTIRSKSGHGARIGGVWSVGMTRVRGASKLLRPQSEWGTSNDDAYPRMSYVSSWGIARDDALKKMVEADEKKEFDDALARKEWRKETHERIARRRDTATREHRKRWQVARRTWKHNRFDAEEGDDYEEIEDAGEV